MGQFAGVLLQVQTGDADPLGLSVHLNINPAIQTDRLVVLGDLVGLRRIGIKVVFAVEFADVTDRAVQCHSRFHGIFHCLPVQYRQDAWMPQTDRTGMCIRRSTEFRGAAAEDFGLGMKLHMNFQPDDRFVFSHIYSHSLKSFVSLYSCLGIFVKTRSEARTSRTAAITAAGAACGDPCAVQRHALRAALYSHQILCR
ncbi:hypothetical protein D3C75_796960 [compost metagenome]